ncbi:MAG TPA: hypothetical protein VL738_40190, partial [Dactylosporangium sp.]|nr:hypothetical protein [Dactylosporangium sp.]
MNRTETTTARQDRAIIARADLAEPLGAEPAPAVVDNSAALAAFRSLVTESTRDALAGVDLAPVVHLHQHTHHHYPAAPAPGYAGTYPAPAEAAYIVPMAPPRHLTPIRHWGRALAYTSVGVMLAGAAAGVVVGTAAGPVGMCAGGIIGAAAGTARAIR